MRTVLSHLNSLDKHTMCSADLSTVRILLYLAHTQKTSQGDLRQEEKNPVVGMGESLVKGAGMVVVSLRGINFGFWFHLGCSGQNAIIFSGEGHVKGCT